MFRLTYFKATHVIGFMSGLGKKNVVLDLHDFRSKDIICIIGDNATGKSTFLSLVHPMSGPSDDRTKFIIQGKEGQIIRTYEGDDGTVVNTRCVYSPKPDGGHSGKYFFSIKRGKKEEEVELNPNGNLTSYNSLIYTYFGINKDYVSFASYSDAVASIVTMTDTARKNSVANMIPNTARFELAYTTVNDKYRELRNLIRNVSQKISLLRDEESLTSDLKRVLKAIAEAQKAKDEYMRKVAKAEGRIKELSHDESPKKLMQQYDDLVNSLLTFDSRLESIKHQLHIIYNNLNLEYDPESVSFKGMDELNSKITKFNKKIASSDSEIDNATNRISKLETELFQIDKDINESESVLFGLQTQDLDELKKNKKEYIDQLDNMEYSKHIDDYSGMSYDEAVTFSKVVALCDRMIMAMYEEYGDLVSEYFRELSTGKVSDLGLVQDDINHLTATITGKSNKRDELYRKLIEKQQYRKFQDILDQRPKTCHIDSCPFIANALKFKDVSREIDELEKQYNEMGVEIAADNEIVTQNWKKVALRQAAEALIEQLSINESLVSKYFHCSLQDVYKAVSIGTWGEVLDIMTLKKFAAVLSEKDLYEEIVWERIPEIDHAIEMAKLYGTNREMIKNQIDRLHRQKGTLTEELDQHRMTLITSRKMRDIYRLKLDYYQKIDALLYQYQELANDQLHAAEIVNTRKDEINTITSLYQKCDGYQRKLREAEEALEELNPIRQQIQLDMNTLMALKEEKDQIERDFLVVEVLRNIAQPGKGIRKELIRLYMYDIFQTANQLLMSTFEGKLYLKEFIITDKEFIIPYVYNGSDGSDIAYASSSQQSTIAMALSLAIISKLIDKYGVVAIDEADRALSAENKAIFVDILSRQMKYIGISQAFVITHSPEYYEASGEVGFLAFPGAKFHKKGTDYIEVG